MLIRSSPEKLERLRMPIGPLTANWDHPLAANLRGLWVGNTEDMMVDLSGQNPDLTFQGTMSPSSGLEGPALDCSPSGTSGARLLFNTGSSLNMAGASGNTVFVRAQPTSTSATDNSSLFGIQYAGAANPYSINMIGRAGNVDTVKHWWNTSGSFNATSSANALAANDPRSIVQSHIYGTSFTAYSRGLQTYQTGVFIAAPTYSGTNDILCFGYNGVDNRNSQISFYIGGVVAHGWGAEDAALFEADPYGLVKQHRSFLSLSTPVSAPTISVTGNAVSIADGDSTPDVADDTDFGSTTVGGATISKTFTVTNGGTSTLNISSLTVPTGYTVTEGLSATIASSGSDTFTVRLDTAIAGTKTGDITISSDATNYATFNFAITGTVTVAAASRANNRLSYPFTTFGSPF